MNRRVRKTNRRQFLKQSAGVGALVGFPAIVRSAGTQRFEKPIVCGNNAKDGDPNYISMSRIPEILKEKYDIEMEFQIHPMSTIGTDVSQLEAVQTGFIDMTSNATAQFSVFSTEFEFVGLPYAITDWDMADRLYGSDLWKEQAASFEQNVPVKVLPPLGSGGFRLLWNNVRPLPSPDAVQGLKFRTVRSPLSIGLIKAWGGNPTPLPWTETYNGLKSGVVDGFHVQPIWTYKFNMHEVLKYATEVKALFLRAVPGDERQHLQLHAGVHAGTVHGGGRDGGGRGQQAGSESRGFLQGQAGGGGHGDPHAQRSRGGPVAQGRRIGLGNGRKGHRPQCHRADGCPALT